MASWFGGFWAFSPPASPQFGLGGTLECPQCWWKVGAGPRGQRGIWAAKLSGFFVFHGEKGWDKQPGAARGSSVAFLGCFVPDLPPQESSAFQVRMFLTRGKGFDPSSQCWQSWPCLGEGNFPSHAPAGNSLCTLDSSGVMPQPLQLIWISSMGDTISRGFYSPLSCGVAAARCCRR